MTFLQEALSKPLVCVSGCLVWIPLAVWVVSMVQWWVAGEVEATFALSAILVALGLGFVTVQPPAPWLSPVLLLVAVLTVVLFLPMRELVRQHSLKGIDSAVLERSLEELRLRPDNVAARVRAGDVLFRHGRAAHAVMLCEDAVKNLNPAVFRSDIQTVAAWRAQTPASEFQPSACLRCGAPNQPGTVECVRCRAPFLLDAVRGTSFQGDLGRRLVASWTAGALVIGGIPLAFGYFAESPLLLILALVAVGGLAVLVCVKGGVLAR